MFHIDSLRAEACEASQRFEVFQSHSGCIGTCFARHASFRTEAIRAFEPNHQRDWA
jgi:hypothetical protein